MNLGFYYHIPVLTSSEGLKVPAYLGVFLDAIAAEVETLILFMHEENYLKTNLCDYILKSPNIKFYSLGLKTPAWDRFLWPSKTLKRIKDKAGECDVLLVRGPSPLAPAFYTYLKKITEVYYLIVGDTIEGIRHLDQPWWRKFPILVLSNINEKQLSEVLKKTKTIVNSQGLYDKYRHFVSDLHLVRTTTLSKHDFCFRQNTCLGDEIKILYSGSFSFAKGLRELVDAFALLCMNKDNLSLHFVGWDYDSSKPVETYLKKQASELGVGEKIFFHGFKTVGPDLNAMYRMADIYVIPSYHEGFPRTIWEAMANSLPVIATNVGSIPHFLKNMHDALLIEPQNSNQIVKAVTTIIENSSLRQELIKNGNELANQNTLEVLTTELIDILHD